MKVSSGAISIDCILSFHSLFFFKFLEKEVVGLEINLVKGCVRAKKLSPIVMGKLCGKLFLIAFLRKCGV
jgi:hypothetical protein